MSREKESLRNVPIYKPGKPVEEVMREYGLTSVIKLASNENPWGTSPKVKEAIRNVLDQIHFYPDGRAYRLRVQLSRHLKVKEEELLFGTGLDEVIQMIAITFLERGKNAVMGTPSFAMYQISTMIAGGEVRQVPNREGRLDPEGMLGQIDENTAVVWMCNPNNPTGTYVGEKEMTAFLAQVPPHVLVVMDEAYYEYVAAPDYPDTLALLPKYPNLILLRTFSKAYGLAGLRVGYAVAQEPLIRAMEHVRKPFNLSLLAQEAAIAALEDQEFVKEAVANTRRELPYVYGELDRLGLHYYPTETNFIYVEFPFSGEELYEKLLPAGVIVRPMGGNAVRITIGTHEQNQILFREIERILQNR
ncbi:histidinol-phosphate transaminase [Thermicanus aegyptius]|uniref:histidinol-phosphate transaminase n=1 Tax=Thermicanus aegyptius TaxID=94009 RepID=UPI0004251055|nr:histidinol-phosphate transaminase [Thermicanus aegyptius]